MSGILAFSREEISRWGREKARLLLLLAPLVATAGCLWIYSHRVARSMPVAVVDLDHSGLSRTLVRDMQATPQMRVEVYANEASVRDAFRKGRIRAAAILPGGMDQAVRTGRTAKIVFWRDASNPQAGNQLYSAMSTLATTEATRLVVSRLAAAGLNLSQAKDLALPLRSDPRGQANPGFDYLANFSPGLLPMFLQMGLLLAGGSMLPGGWKGRTSFRELLGRSLPWIAALGGASSFFYLVLLPSFGAAHPAALPTLGLLFLLQFAALSFGALVGRFSPSPILAGQVLLAFSTPAFPLSGYTFPEWAMPEILRAATRPMPFSLFIDSYHGFAGWASDRAWIGLGGLLCWVAIPLLLLCLPVKHVSEDEEEDPTPPALVSSGMLGVMRYEFHHLVRTSGLSTLFFGAPLLYFALYGSIYVLKEERKIPIAVVHAQSSALARELTRSLDAHPSLHAMSVASDQEATRAMRDGKVRAVLELPADLDLRLRRREATAVPLVFTTDRFLPANDIQKAVAEVLMWRGGQERILFLESRGLAPSIARERATALALDDRPLANPRETYGDFMLPILGLLIIHQLCFVSMAFSTAAAPHANTTRNIMGRLAVFVLWFSMWSSLWIFVVLPAMDVPVHPQVVPLLALSILGFFAIGSLGIAVGTLLRRPLSVLQLVAFTSYPFFFVSGASWPREMFPALAAKLGQIVPLTPWLLAANRSMRMDAGLRDIAVELVQLVLLGILWCTVALWIAHRRRGEVAPAVA